jgi:hypothetical protein
MQTPSRYRVITNRILRVLVNDYFYWVSAKNNQRWSICQIYIERIPQTTTQEQSRRLEEALDQTGAQTSLGVGLSPKG